MWVRSTKPNQDGDYDLFESPDSMTVKVTVRYMGGTEPAKNLADRIVNLLNSDPQQ